MPTFMRFAWALVLVAAGRSGSLAQEAVQTLPSQSPFGMNGRALYARIRWGAVSDGIGRARVAAALLLLCLTSRHAVANTCVDMRLRFNEGQPPAALVESLKREAAAIWSAYGVDLQWHSSACHTAGRPMSFDVLLDQHHHASSGGREILGDALMSQALIDHVPIRLDREATEVLLRSVTFEQLARLAGHASVSPVDVGLALGRVLAHELGHVLLATRGHQPRGLMRPTFSGEELLRGARETYGLSEPEVVRLRREIRRHNEEVERAGRASRTEVKHDAQDRVG